MPAPPEITRWQAVLHSGYFEADRELSRSLLENTQLTAQAIIDRLQAAAITPAAVSASVDTSPSMATDPAPASAAMPAEVKTSLIRSLCGDQFAATAAALIAMDASLETSAQVIAIARATAPIARGLPSGYQTAAQRAEGAVEFGGDLVGMQASADVTEAGWKKAFEKAAERAQ